MALTYIERLLTAYCLGYGIAIPLLPADRVPVNGISNLALSIAVSPCSALSSIFLVPGAMLLWPRLRSAGLWIAIFGVGVFEVGLIVSALDGTGSGTAPIGTLLPLTVAAVLLGARRRNAAERSTGGAIR